MAEFRLYRCTKCGYEVQTEPSGHYALMSGMWQKCLCSHCEEIVSVPDEDLNEQTCPNCDESGCLSSWNPIDGCCPKCKNEKMSPVEGYYILAD